MEAASEPLTSAAACTMRCSRISRSRVEARSRAISISLRYPSSRSVLISAIQRLPGNRRDDIEHVAMQNGIGTYIEIGRRIVDNEQMSAAVNGLHRQPRDGHHFEG